MAHNHGSVDMSDMSGMSDMPSTSGMDMTMKMYFHGSIGGDTLLFKSWVPTSGGAVAGICIALFMLAIFERYLVALRRACDSAWKRGVVGLVIPKAKGGGHIPTRISSSSSSSIIARIRPVEKPKPDDIEAGPSNAASPEYSETDSDEKLDPSTGHLPRAARLISDPMREYRWSRPFRWGIDIPRGLLQALQTLLHYVLMLTVMTFNIWFIISVVIGAGVGETLFGRFGASHAAHHEH